MFSQRSSGSAAIPLAISVHLRKTIGVKAVAFNKELDPVPKLFVDRIRDYKSMQAASGGPSWPRGSAKAGEGAFLSFNMFKVK